MMELHGHLTQQQTSVFETTYGPRFELHHWLRLEDIGELNLLKFN